MSWGRCRRAASVYLVVFFLAVASAPHDHLNGVEDLLLDQRSDSGLLIQVEGARGAKGPWLDACRVLRDIPCLACFGGDFVGAPAASIAFTATLTPLPMPPVLAAAAAFELLPAETSSRAPPAIS